MYPPTCWFIQSTISIGTNKNYDHRYVRVPTIKPQRIILFRIWVVVPDEIWLRFAAITVPTVLLATIIDHLLMRCVSIERMSISVAECCLESLRPHLNAGYCSLRNWVEFEIRGSAVKLGFRLFYIILFLWIVSVLQPWQESHCLLNGITIVEREIIFNNEITQGNQLSLNCSCSQQGMDLVSVTPNKILCYTRPFC